SGLQYYQSLVFTCLALAYGRIGARLQSGNIFILSPVLPVCEARQLCLIKMQCNGQAQRFIVETAGTNAILPGCGINVSNSFSTAFVNIQWRGAFAKIMAFAKYQVIVISRRTPTALP